jgi:hypothetical protein
MNRFKGSGFKVQGLCVFNIEPRTQNIEPPSGTTAARWLLFNNRITIIVRFAGNR